MIVGVAIVLPRIRRPVCPVCMRRTAELIDRRRGYLRKTEEVRETYFEARYQCRPCKVLLIQRDGGPLITQEAFDAGVRELPPAATVRR